jgi:hypothetical protein
MEALKIEFPYKIDGEHVETEFRTVVERKEDVVSFMLDYDLNVLIDGAELKSKEQSEERFIYVYKFGDLDSAIAFTEEPVARAVADRETDVEALEREMDEFMAAYEMGESKRKRTKSRKVVITGEDGFMKYV